MKLKPTISVVIPAYNRAHVIGYALTSVLSQSVSVNEIVVVDDGSTDHIESVLADFQDEKTPLLRVIRQSNKGPSAARNYGARSANSTFILFLDSDDRLLPNAIHHLTCAMAANDHADMIFGGRITILPSNRRRLTIAQSLDDCRVKNYEDELLAKRPTVGIGAAIIKKTFVESYPFPEHFRICEDQIFYATAFLKGECLAIRPALVEINQTSHHRFRDASLLYVEHQAAYEHALNQADDSLRKSRLRKKLAPYPALRTFRELHRAGQNKAALPYYFHALRLAPCTALHLSYLRKFIRAILGVRHPASVLGAGPDV
jgi:glycosyltransferase involved in cell wall biosynthesis